MKIAMIAGGTGGHIYPALALAEELKTRNHDITFIGSNNRMEKDVIPANGYKYIGLDVLTTSGGIITKVKSLFSMLKAYEKSLNILKDFDMAIGFGNYISVPVMKAAIKLKLKTVLHEQNSFVGRANRLLDKDVDLIIGSYEEDKKQFKNSRCLVLGNPQSSKAYNLKKDPKVIEELGLDPNKRTVVIFMGSLGSTTVNEKLIDYFKVKDGDYQVVYATGSKNYELAKQNIEETKDIKVVEAVDGINVMNNSTLLVSRAGATTISEICAIGMPAILIPSPFVPNNHQYYNGKTLLDNDAALMLLEKDLTGKSLNDAINNVIYDDERLKRLKTNALKLSNPNVISDIIKELENL